MLPASMANPVRQSRGVAKKDQQLVLRLPSGMLEAVKAHQAAMQKARPFQNVSLAEAARDLIEQALAKKKR